MAGNVSGGLFLAVLNHAYSDCSQTLQLNLLFMCNTSLCVYKYTALLDWRDHYILNKKLCKIYDK